jgi:hypothetical protein
MTLAPQNPSSFTPAISRRESKYYGIGNLLSVNMSSWQANA